MALFAGFQRAIAAQRGQLLCWVPIFLAIGIGTYFSLDREPGARWYQGGAVAVVFLAMVASWSGENLRPLVGALIVVIIGAMLAGLRAHMVTEPVLGFRYYGPVQGRIVKIDRSVSDAVRLTLDQVVLKRMAPDRTPARVRISLHGMQGFIEPEPGLTVILTANLSPPSGPVEPGGFDFQRQAWFDRLGAVGYTRTPVLALAPPQKGGIGLRIYRVRTKISAWVQAQLPGKTGAFAAAVMTGDRSALDRGALEDLRASNLAHLLAISGLHMGLLTGFIYGCIRYGLALVAPVALRWPIKKIGAVFALGAGAGYLALSGGNVATERAFVMVAVMFAAVLLGRRAITLRSVAIAASIILVLRPEVLPEPGFQMSFAATVALVAVFRAIRSWRGRTVPRLLRPVLAVAISSAVAGLATAPVAAAHFNRIADYGLLANLMSVPLMGLVVMPGAVLSAVLAPLGLGWIGLALMRPAIDWILGVAHWVAGLEGALTHVPAPPGSVLPLLALGALWIVLWRGPGWSRLGGLVPAIAAFGIWAGAERPAVLVSDSGRLVGVMTEGKRVLSKARGDGFSARSWLENDGDGEDQETAAARTGIGGGKGRLTFTLAGQRVVHLSGRGAAGRAEAACREADIVIVSARIASDEGPCMLLDQDRLRQTGALALRQTETGIDVLSVRESTGQRLWNTRSARKR